jgi:hypothetical protein
MEQHNEENETGLDKQTELPFYSLLTEQYQAHYGVLSDDKKKRFIDLTFELVEHIRQVIASVNFWNDPHKQSVLRRQIIDLLDQPGICDDFDFIKSITERLIQLAKHNHNKFV